MVETDRHENAMIIIVITKNPEVEVVQETEDSWKDDGNEAALMESVKEVVETFASEADRQDARWTETRMLNG